MRRMMAGLVLSGSLMAGLSGCGGGGDPLQGGQGPAEPPPVVTTQAAAASGERDSGPGDSGQRRSGQRDSDQPATSVPRQFCSFLTTEVPRLKAKDSRLARVAGFAVDYTRWVAQDPNRAVDTTSELDAISLASCPTVRREVLGVLDHDSLTTVLSR